MKMEDIDINDRPRERIINEGPDKLTETELLAIMLGSGTKKESVLELSDRLIHDYGLDRLFRMNYNELKNISGIKLAKASKLIATFEIARRILSSNVNDIELRTAKDLFNYVRADYSFLEYEVLTIILVNSRLRIIDKFTYSDKEYDSISFPIKEIIRFALDKNAFGIFLVHNHPGGSKYPSTVDLKTTNELVKICKAMNIHFFDHIIISDDEYYSILEN